MFSWLSENGFLNNRSENAPRTHTLMSGGVIGVPDVEYDKFLTKYAHEVKMKNPVLTLSELRSDPIFRMYFDIDLLDEKVLDGDFCIRMSTIIQDVIKTYYPNESCQDSFRCVVCTTKTKEVENDGVKLVKNGYHIIYPSLNVNLEQALQLRYNVVYKLAEVLGERSISSNPWSDAIDKAPYMGGLKMCGSYKKVKCKVCPKKTFPVVEEKKAIMKKISVARKKAHLREPGYKYDNLDDLSKRERLDPTLSNLRQEYFNHDCKYSCTTCLGKEKYIENRTYMPEYTLSGDGSIDTESLNRLKGDMYETMCNTSIRCFSTDTVTDGFKKPVGVPVFPDEKNGASVRNMGRSFSNMGPYLQHEVISTDIFISDAEEMVKRTGHQVEDVDVKMAVRDMIRSKFSRMYSEVDIKDVTQQILYIKDKNEKNGVKTNVLYFVHLRGKGSQYCMNKNDDHSSNSSYFQISKTQCHQRCFCTKDVIRRGGESCKEYKSKGVLISTYLSESLFPDPTKSISVDVDTSDSNSVGVKRPPGEIPSIPGAGLSKFQKRMR